MSGITLVQSNNQHNVAASGAVNITFTNPVTTGNVIGVMIGTNSITSAAPTVTDSNGDTLIPVLAWTQPPSGEGSVGVYLFVVGTGGSSFKITVNFAAATTYAAVIFEYSGVNTSTPLDGSASALNRGASTSPSAASLTPTNAADRQIAMLLTTNSPTVNSWADSLSLENNSTTGGTPVVYFADLQLSSTSAVSAGATLSGSANWNMVQFLLQPAPVNYGFVQDSAACSTSAVASLATPAITVTAGHFLIAAAWSNGLSVSTVTDGLGNTYSLIGNAGSLYVYCCPYAFGGSTAVSFGFSGSSNVQVYLAEYSGLGTSLGAVLAWSAATSNTGTAYSGGPVNASSVPAMIWAMALDSSSDATAPVVAGSMNARTTALWACNSPYDLNAVGDYQVNSSGNASSSFTVGNQFDTIKIVTVAIATAAAIPQTPPLVILMNRRNQLYYA